ncbi:hypothetical protein [Catellatospora citrea]|uniref:hypothetical protein n=1 Tax=Catellatospora citrea TaxID=53366 RepID=UPI001476D119|nr:hypothetical protein [Catellatospora citrea]
MRGDPLRLQPPQRSNLIRIAADSILTTVSAGDSDHRRPPTPVPSSIMAAGRISC